MSKKISKKTFFFIGFMALGIVLFGHSIYTSGIGNIIQVLKEFSLLKFMILVGLSFLNFYLYSLRWEIIVKALFKEKKIPSSTFFWDRMAGYALSYVTPSAQLGGEPLRIMLIEEEGVPRNIGTSSTIIDKALEISTLIIFIATGILVALFDPRIDFAMKTVIGPLGLLMLFLVFWFYYTSIKNIGFFSSIYRFLRLKKIKRLEHLEQELNSFEKELNSFYKKNPRALGILIVISLLTILFILAEHFLVAWFMGIRLTFLQAFLASTIPYIAYLLPVPGGLGVLESGHATIFLLLGVSINAFAFVFIIRLRDFIFVLLGLIRGWHKGVRVLKKEFKEDFQAKS
ncbi:flippase-like domain-containing protein [Candidatus Peregrinibacteria bacterium]|nr:flippase-like domain-containing protein [Candidatus Peregrinibacteria bacterium]